MSSLRSWLAIALTVLCPALATAQAVDAGGSGSRTPDNDTRIDITLSSGVLTSTDWSDLVVLGSIGGVTGVTEQLLTRDVALDPGRALDGTFTYWRGRYGFRVHAAWSESCVSATANCAAAPPGGLSFAPVNVDTWLYDVGGMIGLIEYSPSRVAWPYAYFGVGGITYRLDRPIQPALTTVTVDGTSVPLTGNNVVIVEQSSTQFLLAVEEAARETSLALNAGIGADIRLPIRSGGVGLRFEAGDYISRSPLHVRLIPLNAGAALQTPERTIDFGIVHNLRVTAGVVVHFGF